MFFISGKLTFYEVKITVTRSDIQRGKPRRTQRCPVYFALQRAFPNVKFYLYSGLVYVSTGRWLGLPDVVKRWLNRYDREKPVKPFQFDFEFPKWNYCGDLAGGALHDRRGTKFRPWPARSWNR